MTALLEGQQRPGPQEMVRALATGNPYHRAAQAHMSLSAWLEREDPSDRYQDGLDAFERCIKATGIRVQSDPDRGVWADPFQRFFDDDTGARGLIPELTMRWWRGAATGQNMSTRAIYGGEEGPSGSVLQPIVFSDQVMAKRLAPPVPLSALIAFTVGIDGATYEAFYLTDDAPNERTVRIGEMGEIPEAKLTGADHTIRLKKYGRALRMSYEYLRRSPIDLVAFHVARMAVQTEVDKVAAAIDIAVNGDGNASTSGTSYNLTTLDSGTTANNLTLKAFLAWRLKFPTPYQLTAMMTQEAGALSAMLLSTGTANIPFIALAGASNFGTITPINGVVSGNVAMGVTADAPASTFVGLDARYALGEVREIGGNVSETDMFINNQSQLLTITEVQAFWVLDSNATRVLALNA
jgi:hypothetical protein